MRNPPFHSNLESKRVLMYLKTQDNKSTAIIRKFASAIPLTDNTCCLLPAAPTKYKKLLPTFSQLLSQFPKLKVLSLGPLQW